MKITVISVGKTRPPFSDDLDHYRKLMKPYGGFSEIELKDDATADQVVAKIPDRDYCVLMQIKGTSMASEDGGVWLEARRASGRNLCFVIGGADGLDIERADQKLSFGPITLPHQLARVVLYEQIYRWNRILHGAPYHH